jgi:creatinine amidohydrolase
MHLFPERIRADLVPAPRTGETPMALGLPFNGWGSLNFEGAEVTVPLEYHLVSPTGVGAGDPRLCSAESGKLIADRLTEIGARFCAHFAKL